MLLAKEAVRLAVDGTAVGVACEGCPPLADLLKRYEAAGGHHYVCPICFNAKKLDADSLITSAEIQGTILCGSGICGSGICGSGSVMSPRPPSAD
jgi:hypothetical protein